jgi:hypothetical protein
MLKRKTTTVPPEPKPAEPEMIQSSCTRCGCWLQIVKEPRPDQLWTQCPACHHGWLR